MNRALLFPTMWFHLRRLGWPGLAGAVLAMGAVLAHGLLTLPDQTRTETLRASLTSRRMLSVPPPSPVQVLLAHQETLVASLPPADGVPAAVKTLHDAAVAHGLAITRADYRLAREGQAPWSRYQITIPVEADYPRVRAWLGEVLDVLPSIALDEIQLRRDDAADGTVEARVRLTLFLRNAP